MKPTYESIPGISNRTKILNDINRERERQFYLHGEQKDVSLEMLYAILGEEFGEVGTAIQVHYKLSSVKETDSSNLYQELIEVAAVAVKMAERISKNEF